jgi:hypothetical protein
VGSVFGYKKDAGWVDPGEDKCGEDEREIVRRMPIRGGGTLKLQISYLPHNRLSVLAEIIAPPFKRDVSTGTIWKAYTFFANGSDVQYCAHDTGIIQNLYLRTLTYSCVFPVGALRIHGKSVYAFVAYAQVQYCGPGSFGDATNTTGADVEGCPATQENATYVPA